MKIKNEYLQVALVAIFYAISIATWSFNNFLDGCCNLFLHPVGEHFFTPIFTNVIFSFLHGIKSNFALFLSFQVILPVVNLLLVYKILAEVVPWRWSIALSLLGASFIPGYAFREFVFDIITLNPPILPNSLPISIQYPLPGIALFLFLIGFVFASQKTFFSISRAFLVTLFLSSLIYIHALGATFLLIFWFIRYMVRCFRQGENTGTILFNTSLQILLFLIICFPGIMALNTEFIDEPVSKVTPYYFFTYLISPLLLLAIVSYLTKVDIKEIYFRFSSIYALLLLEALFLLVDILGIFPINFDYLSQGIGQSLLHQLYYAPCICFLSRFSSSYRPSSINGEIKDRVLFSISYAYKFSERYLLHFIIAFLLFYNFRWVYS